MSWLEPGEKTTVEREAVTEADIFKEFRYQLFKLWKLSVFFLIYFSLHGIILQLYAHELPKFSPLATGYWVVMLSVFGIYWLWLVFSPLRLRKTGIRVVSATMLEKEKLSPLLLRLLAYCRIYFQPTGRLGLSRLRFRFRLSWYLQVWSRNRKMRAVDYFDTCLPSDTFFLVISKNNRVLAACNERYFEWKGTQPVEGQTE